MIIEERELVIDIDTFHLSTVRNIEQLNNNTPVNTEVLWGGRRVDGESISAE